MLTLTPPAGAPQPSYAAPIARYQPITIAADHDTDGRLILVDDRLSGVLVRLDALHEENHGRWFLETGFGQLTNAIGTIFDVEKAVNGVAGNGLHDYLGNRSTEAPGGFNHDRIPDFACAA